ncbi:MAG: Flp pilus assembly complex ATPase component TadA, partial [Deltaproteobacteria bacterium]|nr:Flp pilus assembly complex ATPase component TadA [Deltaproteobacteria bacterium]
YSILKHLNSPEVNIMTIEDPVEYRLPGINQVQVNADIGLDFATALRSFLRQDPNIILIGEIRDMETARIASQAALTGHLVLATMHTNSALQAVTRLVEIGVEPFLVAPSIIGVTAQRLVRKICEHCKEKYRLSPEETGRYFKNVETREVYFYRGRGCPQCRQTGYSGRIAIHEMLIMSEQVRTMVAKGESIMDIEREAMIGGFKTMRYDGIKKALRGQTTISEIERATVADKELS